MVTAINEFITLTGNNIIIVSEAMFLAFVMSWMKNPEHKHTNMLLYAWLLVSVAVLIRIGFWSVAIASNTGEATYIHCDLDMSNCLPSSPVYPVWSTDWRGAVTLFSAVLLLLGQLFFISHIEDMKFCKKAAIGFGVVIVAASLAVLSI